jgi:hypothetical protein
MKNHITVSSQFEVRASVHQFLVFVTTVGFKEYFQKLKPLCFEVSEAFFFELKKYASTNIRCHILIVG